MKSGPWLLFQMPGSITESGFPHNVFKPLVETDFLNQNCCSCSSLNMPQNDSNPEKIKREKQLEKKEFT
jgi:hypothetical protein